jgi:peptidoglycan/xylan/chitin deacetylase (PgdA/CDA1 family)
MLNWEEVKALSQDKSIDLGAHSRTHPILPHTDLATVSKEISGSKKDIEEKISRLIVGFSYPAGKFNQEIMRLVKESGFAYACGVDGKFNTRESELYSLSRINIDNCPVFVFAMELCGILNCLRRLFV